MELFNNGMINKVKFDGIPADLFVDFSHSIFKYFKSNTTWML
jgi:hypothetical protein